MITDEIKLPITQAGLRKILRDHGVVKAQLFGSYARGQQTQNSDIDLLVAYKPGTSYFDHLDLQKLLEEKSGVRVDLVSKLHPSFKPYIEPELIDLAV